MDLSFHSLLRRVYISWNGRHATAIVSSQTKGSQWITYRNQIHHYSASEEQHTSGLSTGRPRTCTTSQSADICPKRVDNNHASQRYINQHNTAIIDRTSSVSLARGYWYQLCSVQGRSPYCIRWSRSCGRNTFLSIHGEPINIRRHAQSNTMDLLE